MADVADAEGPWFDGVQYLKQKEPDAAFVSQAKSKTIGILGGGMSGLMTAYLLDSAGLHDYTILEASSRIGGRVHTTYLNASKPDENQYQEMGPMRFPVNLNNTETNETVTIQDHKMVFQIAAALNEMNSNNPNYTVNFIPWIQSALGNPANTPSRRPDGTIPSVGEVRTNPSLANNVTGTYSNATAVEEAEAAYEDWLGLDEAKIRASATNVFRTHKAAVEAGYLDFSEAGYLRYVLRTNYNITDQVDSIADFLPSWYYEDVYFMATTWRTIDQGLSRLPAAFGPLVANRTRFQVSVQELTYDEDTAQMTAHWRPGNPFDTSTTSQTFDYVVVAVPFSKVRLWRLPSYSSLLSRAINTLNYSPSCKVALHYETRFWEHLPVPIYGGCGSTNIPDIGSVCYPSYHINSTGPGALLASYSSGVPARSLGAMTPLQHVAHVQRAMIETHGSVAQDQFTGAWDRICWEHDEFQAGAWASPTVGQQELYLPAYFRTEMHSVFVGEHTSCTCFFFPVAFFFSPLFPLACSFSFSVY